MLMKTIISNDIFFLFSSWDTRRGSNNKPSHTVDAHTAEVFNTLLIYELFTLDSPFISDNLCQATK